MGLSELLVVVLQGLESAKKRDGKCFIGGGGKGAKGKTNRYKCHMTVNAGLK